MMSALARVFIANEGAIKEDTYKIVKEIDVDISLLLSKKKIWIICCSSLYKTSQQLPEWLRNVQENFSFQKNIVILSALRERGSR